MVIRRRLNCGNFAGQSKDGFLFGGFECSLKAEETLHQERLNFNVRLVKRREGERGIFYHLENLKKRS